MDGLKEISKKKKIKGRVVISINNDIGHFD